MKLIKSDVEMFEREYDPFIRIEKVGRTCYKSNSEYTRETAVKFFKQLVDNKHHAMLEHAVFTFEVSDILYGQYIGMPFVKYSNLHGYHYITANLRAIKENGMYPLMQELIQVENYPELNYYFQVTDYSNLFGYDSKLEKRDLTSVMCEDELRKHLFTTFKFVCDRGVSHELVRHRPASFAQESTRYCNYTKDKYGREITCVEPAEFNTWDEKSQQVYLNSLRQAEQAYFMMIDLGRQPQQARGVLPTDVKTEVIMTTNDEHWRHFFNLRYKGTTGKPHPNMQSLATKAYFLYEDSLHTKVEV
jgi:thymidylate synthase ThyX